LGHGKLVFERIGPVDNAYNGVCVVDMDQQRKWEISGEIMNDPAVSPDGNNIAYTNLYSDSTWYDVFIMNIDGTNQRDITKMVGQESCPSWTFDGTQILFTTLELLRRHPIASLLNQNLLTGLKLSITTQLTLLTFILPEDSCPHR